MNTPLGRKREKTFCRAFYMEKKMPAQIRDISDGGFKLTFFTDPQLVKNQKIQVQIIPTEKEGLSPFTVQAIVRWLENDAQVFNAGLEITEQTDITQKAMALLLE